MGESNKIKKIFISAHQFGEVSNDSLGLLEAEGITYHINPYNRKMTTSELISYIADYDALIAGPEVIDAKVFDNASNLKLISRAGAGFDGIDFEHAKKYGIRVTSTPDAPTLAVAELCIALMLDCLRHVTTADHHIRQGHWQRRMGGLLHGKTVGIVGLGRIGKTLSHLLQPFNVKILGNDLSPDIAFGRIAGIEWVDKNTLFHQSDIVSLNVPLIQSTYHLVDESALKRMKPTAILINTARGKVIDELALIQALKQKTISGAAIDVFEDEPYNGQLRQFENTVLTCHMGASTKESRYQMELEAVQEIIRFNCGEKLLNEIVF